MTDTEITNLRKKSNKKVIWTVVIIVLGILTITCASLYFFWIRPLLNKPISEAISDLPITPAELPTAQPKPETTEESVEVTQPPVTISELLDKKEDVQAENTAEPICGDVNELMILLIGIDYRGEDYLYGLADVIRLVHVDFTEPRVDVVALPRALLVQVPPNLDNVAGPILLNQGYLFGTPGMAHYDGLGEGAGSLAETIMYNFGINIDHYVVFDWVAFTELIDKLGGVEVDLPTYVDDRPYAYFPPGKQTLTGEEALTLARIRRKYSDNIRIDNQDIIIQAVINKMRQPETLIRLPLLAEDMLKMILTDGSIGQVPDAICMLRNIDREEIQFYNPSDELIYYGWEYIPTVNRDMNIFRWDSGLVEWMFNIFWPEK
jgi:LCP family protein required for cell wall assembly